MFNVYNKVHMRLLSSKYFYVAFDRYLIKAR